LPFIHWFDWIEPNTSKDLSIAIRNVNMARRMITDPPFENVAAAPNSAHKSRFRLKWRCSSTFEGMRAQAHGNFEAPLPDDFTQAMPAVPGAS